MPRINKMGMLNGIFNIWWEQNHCNRENALGESSVRSGKNMANPNNIDLVKAIEVTDLHKSFGSIKVLKGVSLDAHQGEVIAIIGGSGPPVTKRAPSEIAWLI